MTDKWIQGSIKHKGRVHRDLMRLYGKKAFKEDGTIKMSYLDKAYEHAKKMHETSLERAINEAKNLKRLSAA